MRRLLRDFSLVVAAVLAIGCGSEHQILPPPAGDAGMVPVAPTYRLELETSAMAALRFGESIELAVRYLDEARQPVAARPVNFALLGSAHDSSLSETEAVTDAQGVARIAVSAGETVTGFQVRASAANAAPVFFDVSVSDNGFGVLEVSLGDASGELGVERWVAVRTQGSCASPSRDEADFEMRLSGDDRPAVFPAIPAGVALTVRGEGRSVDGVVVASACRDGIEVQAEERSRLTLNLEARPLVTMGSYESRVIVTSEGVGTAFAEDVVAPAEAALEAAGGTAGLLLDALRQHLREDPGALMLLDTLEETGLERRLNELFGEAEVGFEAALASVNTDSFAELSRIAVDGRLRVGEFEGTEPVNFEVRAVYTGEEEHPFSMSGMDRVAELRATTRSGAVAITSLALPVPSAAIVEESLIRALVDETDPALAIAHRASCDRWPRLREVAEVCDSGCVEALCEEAAARTWGMVAENLQGFGRRHDRIELAGDLSFADEDADRVGDQLTGELPGQWAGEALADGIAISGTWEGTRILPMD